MRIKFRLFKSDREAIFVTIAKTAKLKTHRQVPRKGGKFKRRQIEKADEFQQERIILS